MIYLNYAATSFPKPQEVIDAYVNSIKALPSGQYRSVGFFGNADVFRTCRQHLGKILGIQDTDRIFFTSGSTESLNLLLYGLNLRPDQFLTTAAEHNSVLRPLFNMEPGAGPVIVPCDENGIVSPKAIEQAVTDNIRCVVVNHCSNVTGAVQDMREIGAIAKRRGLIFLADCSQSAGCMEIKADEWQIDGLAFTGHKSLMGMQGTGGFYISRSIALKPIKFGGTGRDSRVISYEHADFEYEVGTQNAAGIAALGRACELLLEEGIDQICRKEKELGTYLVDELKKIHGVRIYGEELQERGPLVSLNISGFSCADAAYILQNSYDVVTRSGLQCAPLIHSCIGSGEGGTLRISFSYHTTKEELDAAIDGIRDIAEAGEAV